MREVLETLQLKPENKLYQDRVQKSKMQIQKIYINYEALMGLTNLSFSISSDIWH